MITPFYCIPAMALLFPVPGCAPLMLKETAALLQNKYGGHPNPFEEGMPLPWKEFDPLNPLAPHQRKVVTVVCDPIIRAVRLANLLMPKEDLNWAITSGELFKNFPVETMPQTDWIEGIREAEITHDNWVTRVRVFREGLDLRTNMAGFLGIHEKHLPTGELPVKDTLSILAREMLRTYYSRDYEIIIDRSYFR